MNVIFYITFNLYIIENVNSYLLAKHNAGLICMHITWQMALHNVS